MSGYHSSVTSGSETLAYTLIPYTPDAGSACGAGSVTSPGTLDGVSIVGGHEEAKTQTDPNPGTGWFDASTSGEVGDLCAWTDLADIAFPDGRSYPVQPLYSNAAGGCALSSVGISGPGGSRWTAFTLPTGDTGYNLFLPWGGYLYYGPDLRVYRLTHSGEVNAGELLPPGSGTRRLSTIARLARDSSAPPAGDLGVAGLGWDRLHLEHRGHRVLYCGTAVEWRRIPLLRA